MPMTVVNARVEADDVQLARHVLERRGLNMSWAIRATIEYIARTGSVPSLDSEEDSVQVARQTTDFFESLPPGEAPEGWGDVTLDREIINEERERRWSFLWREAQVKRTGAA